MPEERDETGMATRDDARLAALALLDRRAAGATICPSEVARAIAPAADWRAAMPVVHAAVDGLLNDGTVQLSWKGEALATRDGPYRIALSRWT